MFSVRCTQDVDSDDFAYTHHAAHLYVKKRGHRVECAANKNAILQTSVLLVALVHSQVARRIRQQKFGGCPT